MEVLRVVLAKYHVARDARTGVRLKYRTELQDEFGTWWTGCISRYESRQHATEFSAVIAANQQASLGSLHRNFNRTAEQTSKHFAWNSNVEPTDLTVQSATEYKAFQGYFRFDWSVRIEKHRHTAEWW